MAVFQVDEDQTAKYTAVIKDEDGSAVGSGSLSTLTLTLYDCDSGSIVNSRNGQDVLNTNNVTVDGSGNLTWIVQPADNKILTTTKGIERHIALFTFTYAAGAKKGRHEVYLDVRNLDKVP